MSRSSGDLARSCPDGDATIDSGPAPGLSHVSVDEAGFRRRRYGKGFSYLDPDGAMLTDETIRRRIRALAIPPAWTSVWICGDPAGHIQAVGYDQKGRRQYRYHPKFREHRDSLKFEHIVEFAEALPEIRRRVATDMTARGVGRTKVLATVVHLLETTMIRVGNESYAKENRSYGLTTLRNRHAVVDGAELRFHFKGKSGKTWRLGVRDRRIARIVKSIQDLPGQHLFQYLDESGDPRVVTSGEVNAYLKSISGKAITAKDFRTWTGTVLAAMTLREFDSAESVAHAKRNVAKAIKRVSSRLGNTPTICRKCYIHPEVIDAYLNGVMSLDDKGRNGERRQETMAGLSAEEGAVLSFLRRSTSTDTSADLAAPNPCHGPVAA